MYNRDKIIKVLEDIYEESLQISPYVVIAQPRRIKEEIPAQNFEGHIGLHADFNGYSHGFVDIAGEKVDVARNYLIEKAIESDAKYMFFIGEDTVIPFDGFVKLHETAEANPNAVITGVYYIKLSSAMIMVNNNNHITIPNVDPGQLIEAWQTGMDCMLIPVSILKKLKEEDEELPFCCIGNNINNLPFIGEDNFFVHRLRKNNIKLLVNTDVQCLHVDLASGKYTAHPDVDLNNYVTNIKITEPLKWEDKKYIDNRWTSRIPGNEENYLEIIDKANKPLKFNMGSGRDNINGYLSVDLHNEEANIKIDVFDLKLPENAVEEIYSSHLIEHLPHYKVPELLAYWYKSLKPEGKLILETPDLEKMCKDFENATEEERYTLTLCIFGSVANNIDSPHVWGYYPSLLKNILENIGYKNIEIMKQQGLHPGKNFRIEARK